jgi:hypothetical protein
MRTIHQEYVTILSNMHLVSYTRFSFSILNTTGQKSRDTAEKISEIDKPLVKLIKRERIPKLNRGKKVYIITNTKEIQRITNSSKTYFPINWNV